MEDAGSSVTQRDRFLLGLVGAAVTAIIVSILLWVGITLNKVQTTQVEQTTKMEFMQRDLAALSHKVNGGILPRTEFEVSRLTQWLQKHEKQFDTIWPRLREIKERIQEIEPKEVERWKN